ncbi:hypothetical protein MMC26_002686 [Xylographa opegraphella]|nr:hypothetical protein [Xylographa opegraphella]
MAGRRYAQGVVHWQWMCEASEQLLASGRGRRTRLEESDRSVGWFGVDIHENRSAKVSHSPASDPRVPKSPKPIHHINFAGQPVHERTYTSPAVSFWAATSEGLKNRIDHNGSLLRSVISSNAGKMLDPFIGPSVAPELKGSKLKEWVTGAVDIVYQTYGTWIEDELEPDDDRRIADVPCCFAGCEDINCPPIPYIIDLSDGDIVVNDDGRVHLGQKSQRGNVMNAEDHTPLSTYPENFYTVPSDALDALFMETTPEVSINMPALILETISRDKLEYQATSSPIPKETAFTTQQMSDRLFALFSEFDEADDMASSEAEPLSAEDENISSLSTIWEHTEDQEYEMSTCFRIDLDLSMKATLQIPVTNFKDASEDRAPALFGLDDTLLLQASVVISSGTRQWKSFTIQTEMFDAVVQENPEVESSSQSKTYSDPSSTYY